MRIKPSVLIIAVGIAAAFMPRLYASESVVSNEPVQSVNISPASELELWGVIQDAQEGLNHISNGVVYLSSRLDSMREVIGHEETVKALGRFAGKSNAVNNHLKRIITATSADQNQLLQYNSNLRELPQVVQALKEELANLQEMVRRMDTSPSINPEQDLTPKDKQKPLSKSTQELFTSNATASRPSGEESAVMTNELKKTVEEVADQLIANAKPDLPPSSNSVTAEGSVTAPEKFTVQLSPENAQQKLVPGVFDNFSLSTKDTSITQMKLAIIDASNGSQEWLRHHRPYLEQEGIPVMVIEADDAAFAAMQQSFLKTQLGGSPLPANNSEKIVALPKGQLLLAREPEAGRGLIHTVLWQLGVRHYPVVIENGIAWQESPSTR